MSDISVRATIIDLVSPSLRNIQTQLSQIQLRGQSSFSGVTSSMAGLKTGLIAISATLAAVGVGIGMVGKSILGATSELEQNTVAFETMLGSAVKAKQLLTDIRTLEAKTPLTTSDLTSSAKTLLSYGITLEKIIPTQKMLGDVALGNKDKFDRLNLAYGQTIAKGRLMGQEVLQMVETGFNPLKVISETTGESMLVLTKRMEAGGISAEEVSNAFIKATSSGGMFFNAMDNQSKTLVGMWSTLRSKVEKILTDIGTPLLGSIKGFIDRFSETIGIIAPIVGEVVNNIVEVVKTVSSAFNIDNTAIKSTFTFINDVVISLNVYAKTLIDIFYVMLKPLSLMLDAISFINRQLGVTVDIANALKVIMITLAATTSIGFIPVILMITGLAAALYGVWLLIRPIIIGFTDLFKLLGLVDDNTKKAEGSFNSLGKTTNSFFDSFSSGAESMKLYNSELKSIIANKALLDILNNSKSPFTMLEDTIANYNKFMKQFDTINSDAGVVTNGGATNTKDIANTLSSNDINLKTDRSITNITLSIDKVVEQGGIVLNTTNITESSAQIEKSVTLALTKALVDITNIRIK